MRDADRPNPFAAPASSSRRPPRAAVDDATAEAIRRATLGREWAVRLSGTFLTLAAFAAVLLAAEAVRRDREERALRPLDPVIARDGVRGFGRAPVFTLLALDSLALAAVGLGLRYLRAWDFRGLAPLALVVYVLNAALLAFVLRGAFGMAGVVGVGLLSVPAVVLVLRLGAHAPFVLSPEYRAIIARTRHVRATPYLWAEVVSVLIVLVGVALMAAILG